MNDAQRILANRYQVGELIGRGGMAEVHIGYDTRLGRTVAIKILRPDLARDPSFQTRFRREAQAAAGLNHPSIVAVYDTGEEQSIGVNGEREVLPFIVMEYVEGHTVREILKDGAAAPIEEAVEIVAGVLDALEYAHANGLVHRDIKPANIMLTPTGAVKVMDFGIARAMADVGQTMTQTQAVIGTAQYLSPEQARGENVDTRSDLYSTGCVLFELLCGRPPFVGDSPVSVAYQHVREPAPVPSAFAPDVPRALDAIVARALAKDRNNRYSTAQEFLADLRSASGGGPLSPATGQYAISAAAASGGTGLVDPTAVQATAVMPSGARGGDGDLEDLVDIRDERGRRIRLILILVASVAAAAAIIWGLFSVSGDGNGTPGANTVQVPDVVDKGEDNAVSLIESFDLVANVVPEASSEVPEGLVIRTDPPAGERVERGSTVNVYVSVGAGQVTVPIVNGLSQDDAEERITAADLVVAEIREDNSDPTIAQGRATKTEPAAGELVEPGTEVILYISSGKVQLPNVVGDTLDEADAKLAAVGLPYDVEEVQTDEKPEGTVLSQNPQPGLVDQGTGVLLTVAIPIVYHEMPDVVGRTKNQAQGLLTPLNVTINFQDQASLTVPAGQVISQSPSPGTQVAEGSTVTVVVSTGPPIDPSLGP